VNQDVKVKWLTALRSGQYTQGFTKLKSSAMGSIRHCCLGVLCEIAKTEGLVLEEKTGKVWVFATRTDASDMGFSYPPKIVKAWAGLSHAECVALSRLNDDLRHTFEDVANRIEKDY
jgi:hypothetical protein